MARKSRATPKGLTERGWQLLNVLREDGGWFDRKRLAATIDKSRLTPHDLNLLERMEMAGLIEKDRRPAGETGFIYRWEYRAVAQIDE